jgi:hypothetical protein
MNNRPMPPHLSEQQVSEWLVGNVDTEARRHVSECEGCRARVEVMETALSDFRETVHQWSETRAAAPSVVSGRLGPRVWRLTLAGALLLLLCITGLRYFDRGGNSAPAPETVSDAALLKQIDTEISQDVPAPLQPLAKLVAWDADSKKQTSASEQKASRGQAE